MPSGAPILIICYTFPPSPGIGGRRWAKFAKAFALRGHPVHVVCATPPPNSKPSHWTADAQTPGITVHPLPRRYPTILHRWPLTRLTDKLRYHAWMRVMPWLTHGNHLDATVFWRKQVLQVADELIQKHGIQHVVVSGAPFRLLVYGVELKELHPSIHLVSDLRDPWTWWDNYGHGSLSPHRFTQEEAFEAAVMKDSDLIISPHVPVVQHIQAHYPQHAKRCVQVPHAIDPDEFGRTLPTNDGNFLLIYAGTLYGASEATAYFNALIQAFHDLERLAPERFAKTTMTFLITANDAHDQRIKVREAGLEDRIRFELPVAPREVFTRLGAANAALVFIPSKNRDLLGTKFQELFYVGRPVIHVGEPGEVSRIIEAYHLGISIRVAELARELPRIVTGERALPTTSTYDRSGLELGHVTDQLLARMGL